jgi:predicted transcriptional regulator of viral defense system
MIRMRIKRMTERGELKRVAFGLYSLPGYLQSELGSLAAVSKRAPQVVFCLMTALAFHRLTTQAPFEVWIAIGNKAHPPRLDYPPLRVMRYSQDSLNAGVVTRLIDGIPVRITGIEKTVADCFKFRNKVGLDVAIEALKEALRAKKLDIDLLWKYASINRVKNVIKPYLEVLS